jgi:hypothetical protein
MALMPRDTVPAKLRHLQFECIERALTEANGNVELAANELGVPTADLRQLASCDIKLLAIRAEARQLRADRAEAIIDRILGDPTDPALQERAARFVLTGAAAVDRGFAPKEPKITPTVVQPFVVGWPDEPGFGFAGEPGRGPPVDTGEAHFGEKLLAYYEANPDDPSRDAMLEQHAERTRQREAKRTPLINRESEIESEPVIAAASEKPALAPEPPMTILAPETLALVTRSRAKRKSVVIDAAPIQPFDPDVGSDILLLYKTAFSERLHMGRSEAHFRALDVAISACQRDYGLDLEAAKQAMQDARDGKPVRMKPKSAAPVAPTPPLEPAFAPIEYPHEGLEAPRTIWPQPATPTSCEPIPGPKRRMTRGRR